MNKKQVDQYIEFLKNNNAYYSNALKKIDITDYNFSDIKLLTKQDIRNNSNEIITNGFSKNSLNLEKTNGTTEKFPLTLYKTTEERVKLDLQLWKARFKLNPQAALRCNVYYYDSDILYNERKTYSFGNRLVTYSQMNKDNDGKYLDDLKYFKSNNIQWLIGPISVMYKLAKVSKYYNFKTEIKYIEFTSEYPTPFYKEFIENQFNCKTCTQYSCHELWGIAFTDKDNKIKILDDTIVETIEEPNSLRGLGNAIITKLTLKAMPFLRYSITDLIKVNKDEIYNFGFRSTDKVIFENVVIPWYFFDNLFFKMFTETQIPIDLLPLVNYQIIYDRDQKNIDIITLGLSEEINIQIKKLLKHKIEENFGKDITIEVNHGNQFRRDNLTGKMRAILPKNIINKEIW
ncbi:hypothetical protein CN418_15090 [Bacillus thuringiensis]|uniref:hypothetical protein n=1 Tax=Bacillus thuringiensis TaxID=1428 RepID=UPI000BF3845D|nr:hypothetical protein [Bacillus thuringiensis]PEV14640.1 hypothetical protein CN418_15090 [Bacillus thuringiensis]